uniref:Uncharacterized protein n=1 Tax=Rhizophagus irregularis (strain DAOM 181602 / DAOM 197198 / MUCL 43194) TaxID=747089 RepID=U9SYT1_RHIID
MIDFVLGEKSEIIPNPVYRRSDLSQSPILFPYKKYLKNLTYDTYLQVNGPLIYEQPLTLKNKFVTFY